jgi:hypothetical protein
MSDLTGAEKRTFERLFAMGGGYVLDFSNRTFSEFVLDSTGRDIYDSRYDYGSGSKANRLRGFWKEEPNHMVAQLMGELLDYSVQTGTRQETAPLFGACRRIVERLRNSAAVLDVTALVPEGDQKDLDALTRQVREAIDKNQPDVGLDRLHTFTVKFVRALCAEHGIVATRDKPLHSLFGEYVKRLKVEGQIDSEMTERILKSSISVLEAFNDVRNNQSFAHDNPVLNYDESLLIFNNVTSTLGFIRAIERGIANRGRSMAPPTKDEIPF